ncbi:hypothetical protein OPU71_02320 [Niveibacterium sp. 24ML]|uniref:hypothetical protein n=1 Tax=Niveibacterium sp. 24ML TaxID=2985512 RepID=UPI00226F6DA8|nr:hypothetical protein [Niveibacterium sp. 24ML]MCX9154955.1 hypothetical protein [Niveibacterium sp. 24ML]
MQAIRAIPKSPVFQLSGVAVAGALLAGCASTKINSQWVDPALGASPLRGAKVLVACQAAELSIQRSCEDMFVAQLAARGVVSEGAKGRAAFGGERDAVVAALVPLARSVGAMAVLHVIAAPDASYVSPGPSISFGFGGGSWGGGGGGAGGIGISMPVGGASVSTAYGAESSIYMAADGRVAWSAKAVAPPSDNLNGQLAELAKIQADAAQKAGLF